MFPFLEALGKSSHFITGTSPTRWGEYIHRLLVYAIMILGFIGITTLVTADMGLECIENCRQSSGRCLDHAEAANKRPYVNAACEDHKKHLPERYIFFGACLLYGVVYYICCSDSDSDTTKLVRDFNELDHESALSVISGENNFRYSLANQQHKVNTVIWDTKALSVYKQIILRQCNLANIVGSFFRYLFIFIVILSFTQAWRQKYENLPWLETNICNRDELNLAFLCTYRNRLSIELIEQVKGELDSVIGLYLMFALILIFYKLLIFVILILSNCCGCWSVLYFGSQTYMETRWLFIRRFGYWPETEMFARSNEGSHTVPEKTSGCAWVVHDDFRFDFFRSLGSSDFFRKFSEVGRSWQQTP